jgi:hypothetical protein
MCTIPAATRAALDELPVKVATLIVDLIATHQYPTSALSVLIVNRSHDGFLVVAVFLG